MTLSAFLSKLTTPNVQVSICNLTTSAEIISLKAVGYTSLDDTLEGSTVMQWSIISPTSIKVVIEVPETTTEPEQQSNP